MSDPAAEDALAVQVDLFDELDAVAAHNEVDFA